MTLSTTIAAVNAAVLLEVPGLVTSVGSRLTDDHQSPPCLRWVPVSDEPGPAPKFSPLASNLQRALVGLDTVFEVECWGSDFESAVTLRDALVRALHGTVGTTAFALAAGNWTRGDALTLGESVTLRVTLRCYVPETAPTVATITVVAFDQSGAVAGDGQILIPDDTP